MCLLQGGARRWGIWWAVFRTVCNRLKQQADAAGSVWVACPAGMQGAELRVRRLSAERDVSREIAEGQRGRAPRKPARARVKARNLCGSAASLGVSAGGHQAGPGASLHLLLFAQSGPRPPRTPVTSMVSCRPAGW